MQTLEEIMNPHRVEIPAHLEAQAEVPLLTGLQRQGDVLIVPMRPGLVDGLADIPRSGIAVVKGEAGGNTHLLVGTGKMALRSRGQDLGTLVVKEGESAYLIHPEHGATGIGPGMYTIRRQREMADEIRLVAD